MKGSAVIPLDDLAEVPHLAKRNLDLVRKFMVNSAETKY